MSNPEILIIGAGISGLSAACVLAQKGCKVTVLEKNAYVGGRLSSIYTDSGFIFEKSPNRIWMPEIIDVFFQKFNSSYYNPSDLISLKTVSRIFLENKRYMDIINDENVFLNLFNSNNDLIKKKVSNWLNESKKSYSNLIRSVHKNDSGAIKHLLSQKGYFSKTYTSSIDNLELSNEIRSLFEYCVFSMGGNPLKSNASLLINYTDLFINTKFLKHGSKHLIRTLEKLAYSLGVQIILNAEVEYLDTIKNNVVSAIVKNNNFFSQYFISSSDYYHTDMHLLPKKYANYSEKHWNKAKFSISSLLFLVGVDGTIDNLKPYNIFFDTSLHKHLYETYELNTWPENPVFSVKVTSKINDNVAPEGHENIVIYVPVAPGLEDNGKIREIYFNKVIARLEKHLSQTLIDKIVFRKSYAHTDFIRDYHAHSGNILGLYNTIFSGKSDLGLKNRKIHNLYYTGHYTTPGPGISFSLLTGLNTANQILEKEGLLN